MVKNLPSVERSTKIRFGKHVPDSNDQEENTIVFNASNVAVPTPYSNAVYLSPIRNRTNYEAPEIVLLMYDRNTKEITESGESANALIGGSTLDTVANRNNATSNVVQLTGVPESLVTYGNVGIANTIAAHTVSVGSNLYIDEFGSNVLVVSGNVAVLKDMIVEGNLTVNGDTTVIYTENTSIKDAFIELGADNTSGDTTLDLGLLMHRPDALSNVVIGYREGNDEFAIAYTDAQPTDKTFTPKTDEDINVHVYGLTHVDANIYAHEDVLVDGNVYVSQNVSVTEELTVTGNVYADKDLEIVGNAYVDGNVVAYKDLTLSGNAYISGNVNVTKQLSVSGNAYISGNVEVTESLIVSANTHLKGDNVFITHTMDFLDPTTAIVTDQISNVQIRLGQLENVANTASNPLINQVLTYDQDNSEWSNAYPDQTIVLVKNTSGVPMTRGQAVHVTGSNGNNTFEVELADASDPTKMPAIGIVYEDIPINGQGAVVTFGRANGISGISGYTNGDTLYVASGTPGGLTNVKPYGVDLDLIQNVGVVVNHSSGVMFVTGIGRSNDIPNARIITDYNDMQYVYVNSENNDLKKITSANLNIPLTTAVSSSSNSVANAVTLRGVSITSGDGFHGDLVVAGNVTVDTNTFKVDAEANRVGILTASPGQTLDVRGAANVGTFTTTTGTVTDGTHSTSKDTGVLVLTQGGLGVEANIHSTNVFAASHIAVGTSATSNTFDVRGTANVGALVATSTHISDSTTATSKTTGALQVTGGVGIQGDIHATHANLEDVEADSVTVTDATAATDKTSGALQVTGGVGVQGDLYATDGHFSTDVSVGSLTNKKIPYANASKILTDSQISQEADGTVVISNDVEISGSLLVSGESFEVSSGQLIVQDRIIDIANNNPDHDLDIGILMEHPGHNIGLIHHPEDYFAMGYTQNGYSDTHILRDYSNEFTLNVWGYVITQNTVTIEHNDLYVKDGLIGVNTDSPLADLHVVGNVFVTSNITTSSNVLVNGDAAATSKTTGALQVTGGVGVQGDIYSTNVTGSGTLKGATLTGTNLYGTLSGSNTAAVSDLTATGTVKGATLTGTNLYGTLSGSNTAAVSDLTATGTVKGTTLTGTNLYGTLSGSNAATVTTLTASDVVDITDTTVADSTTTGALTVAGGISTQANLYVGKDTYITSNLNVDGSTLHVDSITSNVGIGKTDPGFTLDVAGDINFSGSLYEGGSLFVSTPWTIDGNDLEYTSGNIGIGTDAANATLHVGGNIYSSSNISAYEIEVANVTTTNLIMNTVTVSATLSLDNAITVSNITSNTVQFTNSNVGVVATGNVHANYFKGNGSELTGITIQNVSDLGNTTSNTIQFTNSNVSFVTTSNIHVGGIAKQSSVPAFTVRLTDGTIAGAGDIDYNQVDTDNTSSYTTVDGRFTAPVAGHYFFSAHGIYQNDVTVYDFTINGTRQNINSLCSAPTSNYIQCNISAVLNLNVGDYVTVYQVEGGTFGTDNNVFTGFFIG
jgi:cytoskeletal protein CcmA (bactofilin family)